MQRYEEKILWPMKLLALVVKISFLIFMSEQIDKHVIGFDNDETLANFIK
jgi:hypothetical protein